MKSWLQNQLLKTFYKGYLISATFTYKDTYDITLTIDIGRLVAGSQDAVEYEISEKPSGGYVN